MASPHGLSTLSPPPLTLSGLTTPRPRTLRSVERSAFCSRLNEFAHSTATMTTSTHRGETWRRAMGDFAELSGSGKGAGTGRPTPAAYAIDKSRLPAHLREAVVVLAADNACA